MHLQNFPRRKRGTSVLLRYMNLGVVLDSLRDPVTQHLWYGAQTKKKLTAGEHAIAEYAIYLRYILVAVP